MSYTAIDTQTSYYKQVQEIKNIIAREIAKDIIIDPIDATNPQVIKDFESNITVLVIVHEPTHPKTLSVDGSFVY